jgi:hypothetical protein
MGKEVLFFLLLFYTGLINRALITAPAAHGTRDKWAFSEDTKDFDLFFVFVSFLLRCLRILFSGGCTMVVLR